MIQYVIYRNPSDYPGKYVVRAWLVKFSGPDLAPADGEPVVVDTLEEAREALPPWLYNIGRYADDDPAIYEVWI